MPTEYEFPQNDDEETRQAMLDFLYKEVIPVSNLEQDEYGEYRGKVGDIWLPLYFKNDDEPEYRLAGKFKPTDKDIDGERLYIEI